MVTLLTSGEAALLLRVSEKTVRGMLGRGELPSVRGPGGHRRIQRADVDAILLRRQVKQEFAEADAFGRAVAVSDD